MAIPFKKYWIWLIDRTGTSPLHPQFIAYRYHRLGLAAAKKYAYGKLLDIGCGSMYSKKILSGYIKEYISLDHPESHKYYPAQEQPNILADASKIPCPDRYFHTVLMLSVLEHFDKPKEALSEAARILKRRGVLIITVPFLYPIHDAPYDFYRYTEYALEDLLKSTGFAITKLEAYGTFWESWLLLLVVYILKLVKKGLSNPTNPFSLVAALALSITSIPIFLFANVISLTTNLSKNNPSRYKSYPLLYLIVAKKS